MAGVGSAILVRRPLSPLAPTLLLAIPFCALSVFTINILLIEFGAADLSGAGPLGTVTRSGRS